MSKHNRWPKPGPIMKALKIIWDNRYSTHSNKQIISTNVYAQWLSCILEHIISYCLLRDYNLSHHSGLNVCFQFLPKEVQPSQYLTETLLLILDAYPIVVLFSESMSRADFTQDLKNLKSCWSGTCYYCSSVSNEWWIISHCNHQQHCQ